MDCREMAAQPMMDDHLLGPCYRYRKIRIVASKDTFNIHQKLATEGTLTKSFFSLYG